MHSVAFQLGDFTIYWYGVLVALGFLAGIWTASRRALRDNIAPDRIVDCGPWLIVGALVGSRLFYVVTYWQEDFASKPWWEIFMIRKGGLVFYGGLVGGALTCVFYVRAKRLPLWKIADLLAPSIALGYCLGRLGCLMNGCCYGRICHLPWSIQFPNGSAAWENHFSHGLVGQSDRSAPVHPNQVYESLSGLLLYALLAWLYRRKKFDGQVFAMYLVGYAVLRFAMEFFRGDYAARYLSGWATPAQLFSFAIAAAGVFLLWKLAPQRDGNRNGGAGQKGSKSG